jgi:two-component system, NarL family, nitrate/nitrite response regulator NarL
MKPESDNPPRVAPSPSGTRRGTPGGTADLYEVSDKPEASDRMAIRLLLVSDALLMRAALCRLLLDAGIELVGDVSSCEEAVSLARSAHPDIILVDLNFHCDTFQCVEDLVMASESSRVIGLSDRGAPPDHPSLMELGAAGLVLKQDPPEVLINAIRKVHAGELWLDRVNTAIVLARLLRRRREDDADAEKISGLTKREREIISLVGDGLKNAAIAERLRISEATVRNHLTSIFDKLDVGDRFELAVYAFKSGLVRYAGGRQHVLGRVD